MVSLYLNVNLGALRTNLSFPPLHDLDKSIWMTSHQSLVTFTCQRVVRTDPNARHERQRQHVLHPTSQPRKSPTTPTPTRRKHTMAPTLYPRGTVKKIVKAHSNRPLSKNVDILVRSVPSLSPRETWERRKKENKRANTMIRSS